METNPHIIPPIEFSNKKLSYDFADELPPVPAFNLHSQRFLSIDFLEIETVDIGDLKISLIINDALGQIGHSSPIKLVDYKDVFRKIEGKHYLSTRKMSSFKFILNGGTPKKLLIEFRNTPVVFTLIMKISLYV